MKLPIDEEHDEEVVRVPETFEVCPANFLPGEPDHDRQSDGHDPTCDARTSREIGQKESSDPCTGSVSSNNGQFVEVDHVCEDVDGRSNDNRPGGRLVESDILVKGDDVVQRGTSKEGDKVAAHGEEDEDDIDMEYERCSPGNSCGRKHQSQ